MVVFAGQNFWNPDFDRGFFLQPQKSTTGITSQEPRHLFCGTVLSKIPQNGQKPRSFS